MRRKAGATLAGAVFSVASWVVAGDVASAGNGCYPPIICPPPGGGGGVTTTTPGGTTTTVRPTTTTTTAPIVTTTTRAPAITTTTTTTTVVARAVTTTTRPVLVVQGVTPPRDTFAGGLSRTGSSTTLPLLALASLIAGLVLWAAASNRRVAKRPQ